MQVKGDVDVVILRLRKKVVSVRMVAQLVQRGNHKQLAREIIPLNKFANLFNSRKKLQEIKLKINRVPHAHKNLKKGKIKMTKMKSKKMTKSTFAIIIMGIAMVAMLAFGGTFAYFTATSAKIEQNVTMGYVKLSKDSTAQITATNVLPGDPLIVKGVNEISYTADVEGETEVYVAVRITMTLTGSGANANNAASANTKLQEALTTAITTGGKWQADATLTTVYVFVSGKDTPDTLANDKSVTFISELNFPDVYDNWYEGKNESEEGIMQATISIKIEARALQAANNTKSVEGIADYLFGTEHNPNSYPTPPVAS